MACNAIAGNAIITGMARKRSSNPAKSTLEAAKLMGDKMKRSLQLSLEGFNIYEISEVIGKEFKCLKPDPSSIWRWLQKANEFIEEDIKGYTTHLRHRQHGMIQRIYKRWMPVLEAEALHVQRMRMEKGEMVPVIDENSYKEQLKATEIVIKAMEREARLMDLDAQKEPVNEGAVLTAELISQLIRNQITGGDGVKDLKSAKPILELESGIEGMDK